MKKIALLLLFSLSSHGADMVIDESTGLGWQDNRFAQEEKYTYAKAEKFCDELKIGGFEDWRIPTIFELLSIVNYKKYDPAILDGFSSVETEAYWTSTQYMGDSDEVWGVSFKDGATTANGKTYDRRLRCVRSINPPTK